MSKVVHLPSYKRFSYKGKSFYIRLNTQTSKYEWYYDHETIVHFEGVSPTLDEAERAAIARIESVQR